MHRPFASYRTLASSPHPHICPLPNARNETIHQIYKYSNCSSLWSSAVATVVEYEAEVLDGADSARTPSTTSRSRPTVTANHEVRVYNDPDLSPIAVVHALSRRYCGRRFSFVERTKDNRPTSTRTLLGPVNWTDRCGHRPHR